MILGLLVRALVVFFELAAAAVPATDPRPGAARGRRQRPQVPTASGRCRDLDASDDFVRALVRQLSSHPELVAWLASEQLVRAFVVVVDKIAIGSSPAKELRKPADAAVPGHRGGRDAAHRSASYDRYNTLANVIDAIDPDGAARAYRRLRPLFQQAFDELGYTNLPSTIGWRSRSDGSSTCLFRR